MKRKRQRFEQNKSNIRKIDSGGAMAPRKKKRRRSSFARATLVVTVLLVAAVGTVLSLTVFFKIKSIDVYGETQYTSKQIISAGKVQLESNLIRLDSELVSERIEKALPYIEDVKVKKRLPTTVELNVTAARVAGYVSGENGFFMVSTEGKLLEKKAEKPEGVAEIVGVNTEGTQVSEYVSDEQNSMNYVKRIYDSLGAGMSANITSVDVSDRVNLSFVYRDRVTVRLGSESDLSEKLKFVVKILSDPEKINDDDIGIIYAGNAKKISFLRKGSYSEYLQQLEEESQTSSSENREQNSSQSLNSELEGSASSDNFGSSQSASDQNGTSSAQ